LSDAGVQRFRISIAKFSASAPQMGTNMIETIMLSQTVYATNSFNKLDLFFRHDLCTPAGGFWENVHFPYWQSGYTMGASSDDMKLSLIAGCIARFGNYVWLAKIIQSRIETFKHVYFSLPADY
jgi:hypothetical protein